jgi:hypothetical protein
MRTAEERKTIELRLTTIEDGLGWANAELRHRNTSPLFCPPDRLALTGTQLIDILRRAIKDDPQIGKYPPFSDRSNNSFPVRTELGLVIDQSVSAKAAPDFP